MFSKLIINSLTKLVIFCASLHGIIKDNHYLLIFIVLLLNI